MNKKVTLTMKCEDCGHIQEVTGFKTEDGSAYFGSSYNWCDACDDGKPVHVTSQEQLTAGSRTMTTYTPDCWVMIEIRPKDGEPIRKILAGWSGGYTQGDSWKINSGITETREYDDHYEFDGYSGSTYVCRKSAERMNMIMMSTLSSLQTDMFDAGMGTIEIIRVGEEN